MKNKSGFKYYFSNCKCKDNSFDDIRKAIDHFCICKESTNIIYRSLYDQVYGWAGKACYPY